VTGGWKNCIMMSIILILHQILFSNNKIKDGEMRNANEILI
jgi:hypothetical protein